MNKKNTYIMLSDGKFLGVEVIKVYSPTPNYGIQFFRKVE